MSQIILNASLHVLCSPLPPTIDPTVAVEAFKKQRVLLLNLIRHCLPSLTNSLHAEFMIPQDVYDKATNNVISENERGLVLLDCIEGKIVEDSSNLKKIVNILESERFLASQAEQLVKGYSK